MQNQTYESNFLFPRRMLFFHANRSALLIRGLVFFILGLIGLFRPIGSLAAVTIILGVILLLDAMGALFLTFACRRYLGVFWSLLLCAAPDEGSHISFRKESGKKVQIPYAYAHDQIVAFGGDEAFIFQSERYTAEGLGAVVDPCLFIFHCEHKTDKTDGLRETLHKQIRPEQLNNCPAHGKDQEK